MKNKIVNILKIPLELILGIGAIFSFFIVSIWSCKLRTFRQKIFLGEIDCSQNSCEFAIFKGRLKIGRIFFTDTHINIYQFRCDIRKGVIERDKVAIGYIDGQLVIIIHEQVRELFRAKCSKSDFKRLEGFLWEQK